MKYPEFEDDVGIMIVGWQRYPALDQNRSNGSEYSFRLRNTYPFSPAEPETEWGAFSPAEVALIDRTRRRDLRPRGDTVFHQSDDPAGIYCVEAGHILLSRTDSCGNETAFGIVSPMETLGHRSYFASEPHVATARTLTPCEIYLIPDKTMSQLLDSNPSLAWWFLRTLARDPGPRNGLFLRGHNFSVRVRLIHLLLVLMNRFSKADQGTGLVLDLPLQRRDIANLLGVSPETISRMIKQLHDEDIAIFRGQKVVVPDLERLLDAAEISL